ncbi:MAG: ABC transporter permease subunit [Pseudomonadota bacterium]
MRWINRRPGRLGGVALAAVPFALVLIAYVIGSEIRRADNPADKLLPAPAQIMATAERLVSEPDRRSGQVLLWVDTGASLRRLALGVGISAALALMLGLTTGLLLGAGTGLSPFVATISLVPPLAILPILFIVFGLGELSKVALIVIGIAPIMIRDIAQRVAEIPREMIVKAETLGASTWAILTRLALPQAMPRLIQAVRLGLGPAWLFLIAAEAIASTEGLGYRIFLVRRYLAMDVIITYVLWITLLAFLIDLALRLLARRLYPWAPAQ